MTSEQMTTIATLSSEGFSVVRHAGDMVLMSKGADHRFVRTDGSQKRAHHDARREVNHG